MTYIDLHKTPLQKTLEYWKNASLPFLSPGAKHEFNIREQFYDKPYVQIRKRWNDASSINKQSERLINESGTVCQASFRHIVIRKLKHFLIWVDIIRKPTKSKVRVWKRRN